MNVLSLFDGISGAYLALQRSGHFISNYYASEIDTYAIKISKKNNPTIIPVGDITLLDSSSLPRIDLIVGGSPCQSFSVAGKQLALDDPRGQLLLHYVRLVNALKPKWFLLENVKMSKQNQEIFNNLLKVKPLEINSSLVSAQNRKRLYWTNIPNVELPTDRGIVLKDILEDGYVDRKKSHCLDANYFKGGNLKSYFEKHRRQLVFSKDGLCHIGDADLKGNDSLKRVYHPEGKSPTLTASQGGHREPKILYNENGWRKLTPLECERLQTYPDGYTEGVSNTQRYKMLGNSFTVDVIAHIFSFLPQS